MLSISSIESLQLDNTVKREEQEEEEAIECKKTRGGSCWRKSRGAEGSKLQWRTLKLSDLPLLSKFNHISAQPVHSVQQPTNYLRLARCEATGVTRCSGTLYSQIARHVCYSFFHKDADSLQSLRMFLTDEELCRPSSRQTNIRGLQSRSQAYAERPRRSECRPESSGGLYQRRSCKKIMREVAGIHPFPAFCHCHCMTDP